MYIYQIIAKQCSNKNYLNQCFIALKREKALHTYTYLYTDTYRYIYIFVFTKNTPKLSLYLNSSHFELLPLCQKVFWNHARNGIYLTLTTRNNLIHIYKKIK